MIVPNEYSGSRGLSSTGRLLAVLIVTFVSGVTAQGALAKDGVKSKYEASVNVSYTDNLFHYSDERLAEFELERDTNPRYEGLESTSDIVTRLKLKAEFDWKLSGKRKFSLDLQGSYYFHADNSIADYSRVEALGKYKSSKRNRWSLGAVQTIDLFKKNYLATSVLAPSEWGPASYDQTDVEIGYQRAFRNKRKLDVTYRHRDRKFNQMFSDRDLIGDYVGAGVGYRVGDRWRGYSRVQFGSVDSDVGFDGFVMVDRSYDQLRLNQGLAGKVATGTYLSFDIDYRNRDYTTDVVADDARFDRTDTRLRLRAGIEKKMSKELSLNGGMSWRDNDQDRIGVTLAADESGYQEFTVDFGLNYQF